MAVENAVKPDTEQEALKVYDNSIYFLSGFI